MSRNSTDVICSQSGAPPYFMYASLNAHKTLANSLDAVSLGQFRSASISRAENTSDCDGGGSISVMSEQTMSIPIGCGDPTRTATPSA